MAAAANMSGTQSQMDTVAQQFAAYHQAGGKAVSLQNSDIEYGLWDSTARSFTPSSSVGNAIRVTARRNNTTGGNTTFFGRIFGVKSFSVTASAVALGNPRDICFVVDLSGSMNRDTWTGYGSSPSYRSSSYATSIYTSMMQQIFSDFNFGTYPGTTQTLGQNVGATSWSNLYSSSGPLSHSSVTVLGITVTIPSTYKIVSGDSTSARQLKAYKWVIDKQLATLMPNAKPAANSGNSSSLNYWRAYIDSVNSNSGVIGPRSYVSWCLDSGRDQIADSSYGNDYAQISVNSPNCPYHSESTAGGTFSFPPREYPTHAERRSVIAGLQEVKSKNTTIKDPNQMDWVSIVTFDKTGDVQTLLNLTSNYDSAMQASTKMQAVGYNGNSTNTESGLSSGYNLIKAKSQGGTGRENTQKVVILLTDGVANLKNSSNSTISSYETANPSTYNGSSNYYGSSDYNSDAAFMQANIMRTEMVRVRVGLRLRHRRRLLGPHGTRRRHGRWQREWPNHERRSYDLRNRNDEPAGPGYRQPLGAAGAVIRRILSDANSNIKQSPGTAVPGLSCCSATRRSLHIDKQNLTAAKPCRYLRRTPANCRSAPSG